MSDGSDSIGERPLRFLVGLHLRLYFKYRDLHHVIAVVSLSR